MDAVKIREKFKAIVEDEKERGTYAKSGDVVKLFRSLQVAVRAVEPNISKKIDSQFKALRTKQEAEFGSGIRRLENIEKRMSLIVREAEKLKKSDLEQMRTSFQNELKQIRAALKDFTSVDDVIGFFDRMAENLPTLSPEEIRDALESIKSEDEKLRIEAIGHLREELDDLKKKETTKHSGGGITGRDIIKSYDLSTFLDGTTKTFAIPGNWTVLSVSGTSFPFTYRRLVDYTFTPQAITFTDEINAETSLAEGQTIEILYVSA